MSREEVQAVDMKAMPKYMQLKREILTWIMSGQLKPDNQLSTEFELSEQYGMSRQTVRQAIGQLVQEGWLYRVQGKGTFVSAVLPQGKKVEAPAIGMITTVLADYIFPKIVMGAEAVLRSKGYRLVLLCTDNDKQKERECLNMMLEHPLAGIIIEPTKSAQGNPNLDLYLSLHMAAIPYMMINERYPELDSPCVKLDDELGGFLATEHLIQLGHKRIAGFFKVDDLQGVQRMKGFIRAHRQYGLDLSPELVMTYVTEEKKQKPISAMTQLMLLEREERPSAVVCYNDELAVRLLEPVRQAGLVVPRDLSIIGYDDSFLATATEVKLTTLTHPKEELGVEAANLLISIIEEGEEEGGRQVEHKPQLVIRASTAAWSD